MLPHTYSLSHMQYRHTMSVTHTQTPVKTGILSQTYILVHIHERMLYSPSLSFKHTHSYKKKKKNTLTRDPPQSDTHTLALIFSCHFDTRFQMFMKALVHLSFLGLVFGNWARRWACGRAQPGRHRLFLKSRPKLAVSRIASPFYNNEWSPE